MLKCALTVCNSNRGRKHALHVLALAATQCVRNRTVVAVICYINTTHWTLTNRQGKMSYKMGITKRCLEERREDFKGHNKGK